MKYYVNPNIRNTERVFPAEDRKSYLRLDMNEMPDGLPKEFVDRVLREITPEFLAMYPERERFIRKYADFLGVSPSNITASNGSDESIRFVFDVFGHEGCDVVTVSPTFEMYRIYCLLHGYRQVPVLYGNDWTVDTSEILKAISPKTKIVCLINPNNPMGDVYTEAEVRSVVEKAAEVGAVVLIDEAYHYFCDKTMLPLIREYDNVIVLRTFSKAFAIAGLRLGVALSTPEIIGYLDRNRMTYSVNAVALLFGERILEEPWILEKTVADEKAGREYITKALSEAGYEYRIGEGNYFFVKPKTGAREVSEKLEKQEKVFVHGYRAELLKDYLRVSIGSPENMKAFWEAFLRVDKNGSAK